MEDLFNLLVSMIIALFHIFMILFIALGPKIESNYVLMLHCVAIPFLLLHWILDNKTCVLIMMEKIIREFMGYPFENEDCLTAIIIEPIYEFRKNHDNIATESYIFCLLVWLMGMFQIVNRHNEGYITHWSHLFIV